ncbi:hypothetical protein GF351_03410 [Candidatus Woesearchaeota archaeon]|nr:hypothetical protein [Candidatus Woesearchaeota archaeon]
MQKMAAEPQEQKQEQEYIPVIEDDNDREALVVPVELRERRQLSDIVRGLFCRTVYISPDNSNLTEHYTQHSYQPEA